MAFSEPIGGVIVAAGLSSRMGAFKPMLPLGDSTVIRSLIRRFRAVGVAPIVLVVGRNGDLLADHVADLGVEIVPNPDFATTDMFCSACLGLRTLVCRCGGVFFTPGDSPAFAAASLTALAKQMAREPKGAWTPTYRGRKGHPVLLSGESLAEILAFRGPGGMRGALEGCSAGLGLLELDDPGLVLDADTPEDYQRLLDYCRSGEGPGGTAF